jgi:hypothetical protein
MTATKNKKSAKKAAPASNNQIKAGAKFGYRLVKSVTRTSVTYVNTNGCQPSRSPSVEHTVSMNEFRELVGL